MKFEINQTKIKDCCQSARKVVPHDSKSDLPLISKNMTASRVVLAERFDFTLSRIS